MLIETEQSPETAFNAVVQNTVAFPWFAVRVKSNFERTAALALSHRGYEQYVPEYTVKRYGRATTQPRPLLPGYVLCRLNPDDRLPVLSAPGVVGIVAFGKVLQAIDEQEINRIRAVAESGLEASPCPYLACGEAVIVQSGPLAGLRGILLEVKSSFRLVVSITLLQRSVAAEVQWDWVTPLRSNS
jgi:transcription antitermination factor NusG